jgi:hypothetical protein
MFAPEYVFARGSFHRSLGAGISSPPLRDVIDVSCQRYPSWNHDRLCKSSTDPARRQVLACRMSYGRYIAYIYMYRQ